MAAHLPNLVPKWRTRTGFIYYALFFGRVNTLKWNTRAVISCGRTFLPWLVRRWFGQQQHERVESGPRFVADRPAYHFPICEVYEFRDPCWVPFFVARCTSEL